MDNSPEHIYLDLQVSALNNESSALVILQYNQIRGQPLITKSDDYEMSITRFSLGTSSLPLFTPLIQYNQSNANLTIYSVTLEYTDASSNTFTEQQYVIYESQNRSIATPQPPSANADKLQNNDNTYYDIYNYQYWIYLVNNAFTTCFASLLSSAGSLPTTHAPVLTYDTINNIAILNVDILGYDDTSSSPYIKIYYNQPLAELFNSFPIIIQSLSTTTLGKNCLISTNTFSQNNVTQFPPYNPTYNAIQVYQEFSTSQTWTPISSLVFTSNTLNVVPSAISSPANYINGQLLINNTSNNVYSQIITDFIYDSNYKPQIVYDPSSEFRFFTLTKGTSIQNIELSVYYRNKVGKLLPVYLSNGNTFTCKLYFRKKKNTNFLVSQK
jgi:hypothetical protein